MNPPRCPLLYSPPQRVYVRLLPLALALLLGGCGERNTTGTAEQTSPPSAPVEASPLSDVIETTLTHVIGISYDPRIVPTPALSSALRGFADQSSADLMQALSDLGNDAPRVPYDLSLNFEQTVDARALKAISADGSLYTGGAHGQPLLARFVWLVDEDRQLTMDELIPGEAGRRFIADHVEKQLLAQLESRLNDDHIPPEIQKDVLGNARSMIADGTEPVSENFREYQPLIDAQGRITAIRFVFPPYQVGPYSDGIQTADVATEVLLPHINPRHAALFAAPTR